MAPPKKTAARRPRQARWQRSAGEHHQGMEAQATLFDDRSQPPEVLPPEPPPIFCWVYFHFTFENFRPTFSCMKSPSLTAGVMEPISTFSSSISKYLMRSPWP